MGTPEFTFQIGMVLGVLLITIILFVTEWLRVDLVAILVMVTLPMMGLVDGRETFQGLASTAVISIIAVIIMGRGLDRTGVINRGVRPLLRIAGASLKRIILLFSVTVAVISSFMQNVGAAALFLPALQRMSRETQIPISQLLMPVGFSAIMGGTITLVGSSPLIMLNDLLLPFGLAPFSLFSVTPAGIAIVLTGIIYFLFFGKHILPGVKPEEDQKMQPEINPLIYYPELASLFELKSPSGSEKGPKIEELWDAYNVQTVALTFDGGRHKIITPDRDLHIAAGSVFAVFGTLEHVEQAASAFNFVVNPDLDVFTEDLSRDFCGVVEASVSPHSAFIGKTLLEIRFRHNYHMAPLAIVHQGEIQYQIIGSRVLEPGDVILMFGKWESFQRMRPSRDLLFAQPLDHEIILTNKSMFAIASFGLATALVIFSSLPISVCLMAGALGMILSRVLSIDEAYRGVDWRTVFLLSGLIPLGLAMQKTQAAAWMAHHLLGLIGTPSPAFFILIIGLMTTLLTLVVSNVGATVLLVPLVVGMATEVGIDPRMAALTVGLAASNSFLLPTHQVNALYMGPGGYTSHDFLKVGTPLSLLYLLVLTAVIVWVY